VLIGFGILTVGFLTYRSIFVASPRRALPWSASDVQEHCHRVGFIPDFTYALKAKIRRDDFHRYASRLGLRDKWLETEPVAFLDFDHLVGEGWWDPPSSWSKAYIDYQPEAEFASTLR